MSGELRQAFDIVTTRYATYEAIIDSRTMSLKGVTTDADLVLMIEVAEINLSGFD